MGDDGYHPEEIDVGDGEDEDDKKEWQSIKEQVVCLVDCHSSMFDTIMISQDVESSYFAETMKIIEQFMRVQIISSSHDEIAVVLYGTQPSDASESEAYPGGQTLLPLDGPDASGILKVDRFAERGAGEFDKAYGRGTDQDAATKLRDGLWCTGNLFAERKSKSKKRILLFSNQERPAGVTDEVMNQLQLRVDELKEREVSMVFLPLVSMVRPFNMDAFWKRIVELLAGEDETGATPGCSLAMKDTAVDAENLEQRIESLRSHVASRLRRKRALHSLHWTVVEDLKISVQIFVMVSKTPRPQAAKLHRETNRPLKAETNYVCADTGALLTSLDLKAFNMTASSTHNARFPTVVLRSEEVAALKSVKPQGLVLLGFKPRECLKDHHQIKHSYFVYPNERDLKGSLLAFNALYRQMYHQKKVAICSFVASSSSAPRLVALEAQAEVTDPFGAQLEPPGMQMILLPFADDLRFPESSSALLGNALPPPPSQAQINAAEKLVEAMTLPEFSAALIPNPELKRHYDVIEALALQRPIPPDVPEEYDETLPDPEMDRKAGDVIAEFKKAVFGEGGGEAEGAGRGRKRKADQGPDEMSNREQYAQYDWRDLARSGDGLSKLTNPQLKVFLKYHQLKLTGNKSDFIERIQEHLNNPE